MAISPSREEIERCALAAQAHEFIGQLEDGYDTVVGKRGSNFSAGERQLLCFVRAMVAQPRILILDEATSAVDPQTEAVIQQALQRLFARRTSFAITHRLSTIRHAHQILVLNAGQIVERGRHSELVAQGGYYAKLYGEFARR